MTVDLTQLPQSDACRLVGFQEAEVRPMFVSGTYLLIVAGTKPYANMTVSLVPRIYVKQPEYWEIEVVGCMTGIGLPVEAPYHVSIPLDGIRGTKGIEVIGATKRTQIPIT